MTARMTETVLTASWVSEGPGSGRLLSTLNAGDSPGSCLQRNDPPRISALTREPLNRKTREHVAEEDGMKNKHGRRASKRLERRNSTGRQFNWVFCWRAQQP